MEGVPFGKVASDPATYVSKPFTVYRTDARGVRSVYRRSHTIPAFVAKDFRTYRV